MQAFLPLYVFYFSLVSANYNMMYYTPVREHPVISGYIPAEMYQLTQV